MSFTNTGHILSAGCRLLFRTLMSRPSPNNANREDRPPGYDYLPNWAAADDCKRCASIQYPRDGYDNCFCHKCLVCWVERARNLPHSIYDCTTRREHFSERYIDTNYNWKYHAPDGTTHLYIPISIRERINQSYQRHVERSQSRSSVSVLTLALQISAIVLSDSAVLKDRRRHATTKERPTISTA